MTAMAIYIAFFGGVLLFAYIKGERKWLAMVQQAHWHYLAQLQAQQRAEIERRQQIKAAFGYDAGQRYRDALRVQREGCAIKEWILSYCTPEDLIRAANEEAKEYRAKP
jgi:hypothetical protein